MIKIKKLDHKKVEGYWQKKWRESNLYKADDKKPNKYYVLVELTYSSGDLHMGHWFAWSAPDAYARFKRMQGYNVLFPVGGFDSFGLPAENAAIKHGIHPKDWTNKNIKRMRRQFTTMGPSFDWESEVITSSPEYYRWTQWLFLQLYKNGLAYRSKVTSNWCPKCKTVLANEHVFNGCCWRHTDTQVEQKKVDQWLFRIAKYADKLIWSKKSKVDWPASMVEGQNNWIGRKEGVDIRYQVEGQDAEIVCWTSRPDTNFGATFVVLAPEHPQAIKIATKKQLPKVKKYINLSKKRSELERLAKVKDKTGVFTGVYAINDLNNKKMPIWVSDFVLMSVGSGAVVGVPGHDRRDFEFAKKFGLPIERVVIGADGDKSPIIRIEQVQEEEGVLVNSEFLNGLDIRKATEKVMGYIEKKGWGKRQTTYHLRDWTISRQRYWGAPIPIIYCRKCWENKVVSGKLKVENLKEGVDYAVLDSKEYMIYTVPEKDLPVRLPYKVDYTPSGKAPLATAPRFVKAECPECGEPARRETETMDTYVDSSWYFLRYPDPNYDKGPFNPKLTREWLPIDIYFGGTEHTLGHTLYARFITKILKDLGHLTFDEFAKVRRNHGVILGTDGYKMSKSRGNVVNPDAEVAKYGADSVRLFLSFLGPHDKGAPWSREGIEGMHRFLGRVWRLITEHKDLVLVEDKDSREILIKQHQTIRKVSKDIENLQFNTAIAAIMEFVNLLREKAVNSEVSREKAKRGSRIADHGSRNIRCAEWDDALRVLVQLIAPFAPHIAEELWVNQLGENYSIHRSKWPKFVPDLVKEETVTIAVQVNGKLRATLEMNNQELRIKNKIVEAAKADENVKKWLKGKKVKKTVFVSGKLVNFVTKP